MTVEAFIIAWNEADLLPFTLRHYQKFCDQITVFDNYSDDGTPDIAREAGCSVVTFGMEGQLSDIEYLKVKNNCWKQSQADWVIVCDTDEILYHEDLEFILKLEKTKGTTILKTQGIEIFDRDVPRETFLELRQGVKNANYSKHICFSPTLEAIDYVYGAHVSQPKGRVVWSQETVAVLHYRSVGGPERVINRQRQYVPRMSAHNKRWGLGHHYEQTEEQKLAEWEESFAKRQTLSDLGFT